MTTNDFELWKNFENFYYFWKDLEHYTKLSETLKELKKVFELGFRMRSCKDVLVTTIWNLMNTTSRNLQDFIYL